MNSSLKELLLKATQLTRAGRLAEATAAIQRALTGHAPARESDAAQGGGAGAAPATSGRVFDMEAPGETSVDVASELPLAPIPGAAPPAPPANPPSALQAEQAQQTPRTRAPAEPGAPTEPGAPSEPAAPAEPGTPAAPASPQPPPTLKSGTAEQPFTPPPRQAPGTPAPATEEAFLSGTHSSAGLTRDYKLYVPPDAAARPRALVVMLHGCTQNPDDFAAGTAMNQRAREQGFYVLYPAQSQQANPMRCWNWFRATDQVRGAGEPAVIVGMVQEIARDYDVDPRHIYAAGLSAGGAMAAILGAAYPDVFAAVGVHSGLAPGAASNVMAAMSVMKRGGTDPIILPPRASKDPLQGAHPAVPTIVFQGDADSTVHPRNGEQLLAAVLRGAVAAGDLTAAQADAPKVEQGRSAHGQPYVRSQYANAQGEVRAEYWQLQGAGHAWAGGQRAGTYTDAAGPDATAEMLRFFFAHAR